MPLLPFGCTGVWAVGHNSLTNGLRCQFEQEGTGEDPGARVFWGKPRPHSSNRAGSYSRIPRQRGVACERSGSSQLTQAPPEI